MTKTQRTPPVPRCQPLWISGRPAHRALSATASTPPATADAPAIASAPAAAVAGRLSRAANVAPKSTASATAHVATVRWATPGRSTTCSVSRPRIRSRTPSARTMACTAGRSASSPIQPRPASAGAVRNPAPTSTRPAAMARAASRAVTAGGLLGVDYGDDAAAAPGVKLDDARPLGEDRVVLSQAGAVAGLEAGPALAHDDLAARDGLPGEDLHAEALGVGVATVAARAQPLLM